MEKFKSWLYGNKLFGIPNWLMMWGILCQWLYMPIGGVISLALLFIAFTLD